MLSVIIPTIQSKPDVLKNLVQILSKDKSVSEILIINNKSEQVIKLENTRNFNCSIRVIVPSENLYVNPSWNLGVEQCKNNNFVLMNDDILICDDFCNAVVNSEVFNSQDCGLIGVSPFSIKMVDPNSNMEQPDSDSKSISFTLLNKYLHTGDWGIAIFGKKENYYPIPKELKIIYGDNYILWKNLENNKINYEIRNTIVNHKHSSSSAQPRFMPIVISDVDNAKTIIPGIE